MVRSSPVTLSTFLCAINMKTANIWPQNPFKPTVWNLWNEHALKDTAYHHLSTMPWLWQHFFHTKQYYKVTSFFFFAKKQQGQDGQVSCHKSTPACCHKKGFICISPVETFWCALYQSTENIKLWVKNVCFDCNNAVQHVQTCCSPLKRTVTTQMCGRFITV